MWVKLNKTGINQGLISKSNSTATGWYVLGPKGKTVKMFFLNGQKTPFFERQDMFKVDGATWKVRMEAVAKAMLWQGMVKNAGA